MKENPIHSLPGIPMLLGLIGAELVAGYVFFQGTQGGMYL